MSSIGSPTPLSGPKIDDKIIKSRLRWVDCHYTRRENGRRSNHTKYQRQPGRAEKCKNWCKPAIVAWPPPSKRILLNPQSLPSGARTSNSKVAIVFLKNKNILGVLNTTKFLRDLLPQRLNAVAALCVSLCLTSYHWTCRTLGLVDKKDVLDCIKTNSVIGVDQLVEKRDLVRTCLGKWPQQ